MITPWSGNINGEAVEFWAASRTPHHPRLKASAGKKEIPTRALHVDLAAAKSMLISRAPVKRVTFQAGDE